MLILKILKFGTIFTCRRFPKQNVSIALISRRYWESTINYSYKSIGISHILIRWFAAALAQGFLFSSKCVDEFIHIDIQFHPLKGISKIVGIMTFGSYCIIKSSFIGHLFANWWIMYPWSWKYRYRDKYFEQKNRREIESTDNEDVIVEQKVSNDRDWKFEQT